MWLTKIGILGLALYGATNSLLTIIFIGPYREHFNQTFIFWWLCPLLTSIGLSHWVSKRYRQPMAAQPVQPQPTSIAQLTIM
jgi:hypothetical protein